MQRQLQQLHEQAVANLLRSLLEPLQDAPRKAVHGRSTSLNQCLTHGGAAYVGRRPHSGHEHAEGSARRGHRRHGAQEPRLCHLQLAARGRVRFLGRGPREPRESQRGRLQGKRTDGVLASAHDGVDEVLLVLRALKPLRQLLLPGPHAHARVLCVVLPDVEVPLEIRGEVAVVPELAAQCCLEVGADVHVRTEVAELGVAAAAVGLHRRRQDLLHVHVLEHRGVVLQDKVDDVLLLVHQGRHPHRRGRAEGEVVARPEGSLEAEGPLGEGARHSDEVGGLRVLVGAEHDVGIDHARLLGHHHEVQVQATI
mmetsp:Transcript_119503/g.385829  ORF Transcript_119503/g.385829 Transcript_119503/m.385829 type:complete len:311 (+) Transcript_119503:382-1314(+)